MKLIIDNQTHEFENAQKAVEYMNSTAFMPSPSAEQYMKDYTARAYITDSSFIASDSFESFIKSLLFKGHITAV